MVPTEYRDPKKIRELLINIKKRVEINSSTNSQGIILECLQELSTKHEAIEALALW